MDSQDQQKLIVKVVDEVFVPLVLKELHLFLDTYTKEVRFARDMENISGFKVGMPQVFLDIRQPTNALIEHLKIALKNENK